MAEEFGWDALTAYYDRVFLLIWELQPGCQIIITDMVKPDNYEIFVKCASTAIDEINHLGCPYHTGYYFNETATVIFRW